MASEPAANVGPFVGVPSGVLYTHAMVLPGWGFFTSMELLRPCIRTVGNV